MAQGLRVILFNAEEHYQASLRGTLLEVEGVKIVAEVDDPALLNQVVGQFPVHVLVMNLDPHPDVILPIAGELTRAHPNLIVFGVSESTDGQLILSAMRRGLKEFLTKPLDRQMVCEALERVAARAQDDSRQGTLIAVVGAAGGVGATTLATNLAVEMASLGTRRVCVVDLDHRFGQVATLLDLDPTYCLADLCETHERLEPQVIERALVSHASGLQVLCGRVAFDTADTVTGADSVGVLLALLSLFDYVVADGPVRFDPGAKAIFDLSDAVLLTLELLVPDVRNVQRILDGLRHVGFNLERLCLVCNKLGRENGTLSLADVEATLNKRIYAAIPDDAATVASAINLGEPLAAHHPRTKVRQVIREMAERLYGSSNQTDDRNDARKGGLLSKILSD
jgi:pilus assembly protein CpaE